MNTDQAFTPDELETHEVRILAVLLGEASAAETAAVESLVTSYPQLQALRARLSLTIGLLRDTARVRTNEKAPAQLSPERREALLAVLSEKPKTAPVPAKDLPPSKAFPRPVIEFDPPHKTRFHLPDLNLKAIVGWAGLAACLFLGFAMSIPAFNRVRGSSASAEGSDYGYRTSAATSEPSRDYARNSLKEADGKLQPPAPESKPNTTTWFGSASARGESKTQDFDGEGMVIADLNRDGPVPANRADTNLALSGGVTFNGGTVVTSGSARFAAPAEDFISSAADPSLIAPGAAPIVPLQKSTPPATSSPAIPRGEMESLAWATRSRSINAPLAPAAPPPPAAKPLSSVASTPPPAPAKVPSASRSHISGLTVSSAVVEEKESAPADAPARVTGSGMSAHAMTRPSASTIGRQSAAGVVSLGVEGGKNDFFREADAKAKLATPPSQPAEPPAGPVTVSDRLAYFDTGAGGSPAAATGKREEAARKQSEMIADPFATPAPAQAATAAGAAGAYGFTSDGAASTELRDGKKGQADFGLFRSKDTTGRADNEGRPSELLADQLAEADRSLGGVTATDKAGVVTKLGEERSKLRGLDEVAQVDGVADLRKNMQEQNELQSEFKKSMSGEAPVLGDVPALGQLFAKEKGNKALEDAAKSKKAMPEAEVAQRLKDTQVNHLELQGVPLSQAIDSLNAMTKGKKLNMVLLDPTGADPVVNLTLNYQSVDEALKEITKQTGYEMDLSADAVTISPSGGEKSIRLRRPVTEDISRPLATLDNAFSTFALNVSDASFRLTRDALNQGTWDATKIRSEEFYNAFRYRDPAPQTPIGLTQETSSHPFTPGQTLVRLGVQTQAQGRAPQQPLHLTVLLDNSGSMERADRREAALAALRGLAQNLGPQDTISLVSFSATPRLWLDHIPGDQAAKVAETAAQFPAEGGTNLEAALQAGYEQAEKTLTPGAQNAVILLTDGSANLGNADANSLADLVTANRQRGIAFHAYGVGSSDLNDATLERLARNGDGRYAVLGTPEEAEAQMVGPLAGSFRPAALDVKVQVEWNARRVKAHRLVGFAERRLTKEQFRDNTVDGGELAAAASGNALYSVETIPDGDGPLGTVRVRYRDPATNAYRELSWPVAYDSGASSFAEAPRGLRLAGVAAMLAERLQGQPAAQDTILSDLRKIADQLAGEDTGDAAVPALAEMVRQAETLLNNH